MRAPIASEPFEFSGVWWLPGATRMHSLDAAEDGAPADQSWLSHGTLTYEPDVGLRLTLTGTSESGVRLVGELESYTDGRDPVVQGRLLDGQPCTLLNVFVKNHQRWWPAGGWRAALVPNLVIVGMHVESADELRFARAELRIRGLRELLRQPPLVHGSGGPVLRVEGDRASVRVELGGARLTFVLGWSSRSTPEVEVREVDALASIELDEPAPLLTWEERWVRRVHDLVVFATREPTWTEAFTASLRDEGTAEAIHPAIRRGASDAAWEGDTCTFCVCQSPCGAEYAGAGTRA